jgi:hypothetical protein
MDIGIVRLMATVAISDDVKKQPLTANQQFLITVILCKKCIIKPSLHATYKRNMMRAVAYFYTFYEEW